MSQRLSAFLAALWVALLAAAPTHAQETKTWEGAWQTYWRGGQALMTLHQDGDKVIGTYEPGGGRIEGRAEGRLLMGRWSQPGDSGSLLFARSEDGLSFTGRFDNGEYWNGRRPTERETSGKQITAANSPRETLRTILTAANDAVYKGNAAAYLMIEPLLVYEGADSGARDHWERRNALWNILNISTMRIFSVPEPGDADEVVFDVGPAGSDERYGLRFRLDNLGRWQIEVEELKTLQRVIQRMLADLGYKTLGELWRARSQSPRNTMRSFIEGVNTWHEGGAEKALATLDLSYLPAQLRNAEGPIFADYLKQILDRAGYVIWQEITDDPDLSTPFVYYQHPSGSVVIERIDSPNDGSHRWLFSAETLKTAPALYSAIQDMPLVEGLDNPAPFTDFFQARQFIRHSLPELLHRDLVLENWQWIFLAIYLIVVIAIGWLIGRLVRYFFSRFLRSADLQTEDPGRALEWPVRIFVVGATLSLAFARLGIAQSGLEMVSRGIAVVTAISLAIIVYRLIGAVGVHLKWRVTEGRRFVDEIAASLAIVLLKLTVVVLAIIACADIAGVPYEGVLTGLGVGGVALAFASRETVSNMLGGLLLMADRPFKRGDLIETEGQLATVENVGLRSTRLKTLSDAVVIIPNSQLSDKSIINWGARQRRRIKLLISLTYDTPRPLLDSFVQALGELYEKQPHADKTQFYIGLKKFGESSIDIEFVGFFRVYDYSAEIQAQHALIGDIVELAEKLGVSFAFPTRTIHVDSDRPEQKAMPRTTSQVAE